MAGVVVDGAVRDLQQLAEIGIPVFACGTVCGAGDKDGPGEINVPISCGGVAVCPGDVIFGDENGVVVVPRGDLEEVLANADKKLAYEGKRMLEIQAGQVAKPDIDELLRKKVVL